MSDIVFELLGIVFFVAFMIEAVRGIFLRGELQTLRNHIDRLAERNGTLHQNLRAIRAVLDERFPEAVSVCNSLETALQADGHVDLDGLEKHLIKLRKEHNRAIMTADLHGTLDERLRRCTAHEFGLHESEVTVLIGNGGLEIKISNKPWNTACGIVYPEGAGAKL